MPDNVLPFSVFDGVLHPIMSVCVGLNVILPFRFSIQTNPDDSKYSILETAIWWYKDDSEIARISRGVFSITDQRNRFIQDNRLRLKATSNDTAELIIEPLIKEFDDGSYKAKVEFPQCSNMDPIESESIQLIVLEPIGGGHF